MYRKYFGLKEPSFSIAPDPHYLFLSEQHKEALAHLLYGAGEHGGFVLLTGEVGTGKTTVCRAFLEQLPAGVDVALIVNPALTADELLRAICDEFRVPVPAAEHSIKRLVDRLNDYLLAAHAAGRRPVLIIDEAQNLRPKVMEQVRLLTNLETTKAKLLQIFLIGQPELRRMLERESLRQLNQRITARFHLRPLGAAATARYVRHRVAVAGVDRPLFTAGALRRIHQVSGGVPRVINILCDRALLGACVTRANQVTAGVVARAAREVRGTGTRIAPAPAARPAFAIAASLALVLTAGWLIDERLGGDRLGPLVGQLGPAPAGRGLPTPVAAPVVANRAPGGSAAVAPVVAAAVAPAAVASAPAPSVSPLPRVSLVGAAPAVVAPAVAAQSLSRAALPEEAAMRVLLRHWGVADPSLGAGNPCRRLGEYGLRCEHERGKLSHLRYYDRPALLRVDDADGAPRYVVLGTLDESSGTLELADGSERVPIAGLEAGWTGDYILVWQLPPTGVGAIGPRGSDESIRWLRQMIAATPNGLADTGEARFDAALADAVRAFQAARGLRLDGIAGSRTLIQIQNAAALPNTPRLMTPSLAAAVAAQPTPAAGAPSAAGEASGPGTP